MAKVNRDLQKERDGGNINVEKLTFMLDGSEDFTERRRFVETTTLSEREFFSGPDYHYLSRDERYEDSLRKSRIYIKFCEKHDFDNTADSFFVRNVVWPNEVPPIGLHSAMFQPALRSQGSEEQKERWLPAADAHQILGTYAQTELGHGTHVRGLETTATYDPNTEEFVLHCPTLTATKWWPGGLGKTSNYAIVIALLHSNGNNHGTHPFMVQLRDLKTHQPLPGISVGDIGPKFGFDSIDNGFLNFNHVRIPRDHMLMKNAEITKDGTYVNKTSGKMSYGTMVFVRAMVIHVIAAMGMAQACTISIRYSAVRRQSEMRPGEPEPQILDYQTQQYKLFTQLSTTYALWMTGLRLREMYFTTNYEIQQGNIDMLPELHAVSCGVKALATNLAMTGIERCRLACGGHGYSHGSGLPKIYVNVVAACTYEGENTVMFLQCARYLVKAYQNAKMGQAMHGSVAYLSNKLSRRCEIDANFSLESLVAAFEHRAHRMVAEAVERLDRLQAEGKDQQDAWNQNSVVLGEAAQAHCEYFVVKTFVEALDRCEDDVNLAALSLLCQLYAAHGIAEHAADFIEDGYMSKNQLDIVKRKEVSLLGMVRPNAVRLVDAFDFKDEMLCSCLGRYDGNVYESLYEWAKKSPMNKAEVQESFKKYLQPLIQSRAESKL